MSCSCNPEDFKSERKSMSCKTEMQNVQHTSQVRVSDQNEVSLRKGGRGAQVVAFVSGVYYSGCKEQSSM